MIEDSVFLIMLFLFVLSILKTSVSFIILSTDQGKGHNVTVVVDSVEWMVDCSVDEFGWH